MEQRRHAGLNDWNTCGVSSRALGDREPFLRVVVDVQRDPCEEYWYDSGSPCPANQGTCKQVLIAPQSILAEYVGAGLDLVKGSVKANEYQGE